MSDYPMLISNKLHSFRNFATQLSDKYFDFSQSEIIYVIIILYAISHR